MTRLTGPADFEKYSYGTGKRISTSARKLFCEKRQRYRFNVPKAQGRPTPQQSISERTAVVSKWHASDSKIDQTRRAKSHNAIPSRLFPAIYGAFVNEKIPKTMFPQTIIMPKFPTHKLQQRQKTDNGATTACSHLAHRTHKSKRIGGAWRTGAKAGLSGIKVPLPRKRWNKC
jgi:hypothetical protein